MVGRARFAPLACSCALRRSGRVGAELGMKEREEKSMQGGDQAYPKTDWISQFKDILGGILGSMSLADKEVGKLLEHLTHSTESSRVKGETCRNILPCTCEMNNRAWELGGAVLCSI